MSTISFIGLAEMLQEAGFAPGTSTVNGCSIVCAESGRNPLAKHVNTDGSIDRGLWQINDKAHPDVTDQAAYDPVQATAAAFSISHQGTDYGAWSTWNNGAYKPHVEASTVANAAVAAIAKATKATASLQAKIAAAKAALG